MIEKLATWFLFTVLVTLIPFAWNWISLLTRNQTVNIDILFSRGELLLVSFAISAAAVGELITSENSEKFLKILVGFSCISILIFNSLWFSEITLYIIKKEPYNHNLVAYGSIVVFLFTALSAFSANVIAGLR